MVKKFFNSPDILFSRHSLNIFSKLSKTENYFHKNAPLLNFEGVLNTPLSEKWQEKCLSEAELKKGSIERGKSKKQSYQSKF